MTPRYFLASSMANASVAALHHDSILIALPNIKTTKDVKNVLRWAADGKHIIIDSGVFEVCSHHARANNIPLNAALALAPAQVDGFPKLLEHYERISAELTGKVFAIAEVDIGGKVHKRATRSYLEAKGMKPSPVFHPLLDGWDYLDELAENYKIIFVGNVVNAPTSVRLAFMAKLMLWREDHPHVWIHLLGVTPSTLTLSMPMDSYDSSTWLANLRWSHQSWRASALWNNIGGFGRDMAYERQDPKRLSMRKANTVVAIDEACQARSATHYSQRIETLS